MEKLRIAVCGVGGISGVHIPAWQALDCAELVALCDIRPGQMERYDGVHKYTDFDEMLEAERIDILDICLPTYLHAEYAIRAMEHGIHVLCEKPISLERDDVRRIYGAAERNHVKFMVAQVLRFWPEYVYIKRLYDEKTYGALLSGTFSRLGKYPEWSWDNWMMDESRSGLVPFDLHIHDLDFLLYAFGSPKEVIPFRSKRQEQDYVHAMYVFDGFFVDADAAWYASPYPFSAEFLLQFENAVVSTKNGTLTIYERSGKVIKPSEAPAGESGVLHLPQTNAYAEEIRYFADCVLHDKQPDMVKPEELERVIEILRTF